MATARILFCLLYFTVAGWRGLPGGDTMKAEQILTIARSQLVVRELKDHNDGPAVESYLALTGLKKGEPWCAAFLSWVFSKAGYSHPRTAWSPALFPKAHLVKLPAPGILFGIYFPSFNRIAHCGIIEHVKGDFIFAIEGNTNIDGGRDGDGVYRKIRHKRTVYRYANWITNNN